MIEAHEQAGELKSGEADSESQQEIRTPSPWQNADLIRAFCDAYSKWNWRSVFPTTLNECLVKIIFSTPITVGACHVISIDTEHLKRPGVVLA